MDRVLVQKAEAVAKTKGGIIIPEKAQSKVSTFCVDNYDFRQLKLGMFQEHLYQNESPNFFHFRIRSLKL